MFALTRQAQQERQASLCDVHLVPACCLSRCMVYQLILHRALRQAALQRPCVVPVNTLDFVLE